MQGTTRQGRYQAWQVLVTLATVAAVSMVVVALAGQTPETVAGWVVQPALLVGAEVRRPRRWWHDGYWQRQWAALQAMGRYLRQSWRPMLVRSLLLWLLWAWSGAQGVGWPWLAPWCLWVWQGLGAGWPGLRTQAPWRWLQCGLWQGQRLLLVGYGGLALQRVWLEMPPWGQWGSPAGSAEALGWSLSLGCVAGSVAGSAGAADGGAPQVKIARQADGSYQARLHGDFTLTVAGDDPLRLRLLLILLSQLDVTGSAGRPQRHSRRTRDGRTPFVRQLQLAAWLEVPQSCISRWLGYWHTGNWADLLSLHSPQVLTGELCARIVSVCATFPHWEVARVHAHLRTQGVGVTEAQVRQAVTQSGWQQLQQTLFAHYALGEACLQLRDPWLVAQLLAQITTLLALVENRQSLPAEVRIDLADLTTLAAEAVQAAGATAGNRPDNWPPAATPIPTAPWLLRLEQMLFCPWRNWVADPGGPGAGAALPGELPAGINAHKVAAPAASQAPSQAACPAPAPEAVGVRCPYCGADQVGRKSAKPRRKKYYDAQQQLCEVAVYRYYCHNPHCAKGSFTALPPGLALYSPYRSEVHLLAVQMYTWGYSTYRRTGAALGVASLTAWRWVSAWGHDLLPVAALFGVVRSSGVVGIDEKYVLVPKNDKPAAPMRRWMYVYLAVDAWTYDLLHIALYPYNSQDSAHAFLLALRAKGYHPQVIVTDLRQDYGLVIAQVFPHAVHHECIFHALQTVQRLCKEVYGPGYAEKHPAAAHLKQQIHDLFATADTDTPALAHARCAALLAQRQDYVQTTPAAAAIFDFLERHWPTLTNSIGVDTIPHTNNAVERVIRRFHQHYQGFNGFESARHAQAYLAVFEKFYRFTPFSQDAQPHIRGKSPLQLAGYDVANLPFATLCSGFAILWLLSPPEHVPKS